MPSFATFVNRKCLDSVICELLSLTNESKSSFPTVRVAIIINLVLTEYLNLRSGRSALIAAVVNGHVDVVQLLLFWCAAVDTIDLNGRSVLSIAAACGHIQVVRQLLDRGLDEGHRDHMGATPLHLAAAAGHADVVR